ncbi:MAG TPA: hypothetical protein VL025_21885 [Thermoanaerobaculia bacterium]|nr:hypothetical protein [Thermoanaerobaculia bacterium]
MKRIHCTRLLILLCLALTILAAPGLAQRVSPAPASPLAKYPGFGHNAEADEAQFDREETAREERVARCMEREGFTYWPMKSITLESFPSTREAMAALRDNPNDRYATLLSEEGRLNYNRALFGVDDPNALEAEKLRDPADASAGGCAAEALRLIPGVFAARSALTEEFHAMRQAALSDQRVKAAEAQWSACMQKQGYSLSSPRDLRRQMDAQLAGSSGKPEDLKKLGADHRRAAESSTVCAQQSNLGTVVAAVRVDYERAFVRKHRKFLEAFLKTLEQQPLDER